MQKIIFSMQMVSLTKTNVVVLPAEMLCSEIKLRPNLHTSFHCHIRDCSTQGRYIGFLISLVSHDRSTHSQHQGVIKSIKNPAFSKDQILLISYIFSGYATEATHFVLTSKTQKHRKEQGFILTVVINHLKNQEPSSKSHSLQLSQTLSCNFYLSFKFPGTCFYNSNADHRGCGKDPSCSCTTHPFPAPRTWPKNKSACQADRRGNTVGFIASVLRESQQNVISDNLEMVAFLPRQYLGKSRHVVIVLN